MYLKKQSDSDSPDQTKMRQNNESLLQWPLSTSFSELYSTPKITDRMRQVYDSLFKTRKMEIRLNNSGGSSKWIFKTELKIVSQQVPQKIPQDLSKDAKLSRVKAYIILSEREWQRESQRLKENKNRFQQLMRCYEKQKENRIKLKKRMVYIFMRKMKLNFLIQKLKTTDHTINQIKAQTGSIQQNIQYLQTSIKLNEHTVLNLQNQTKMKILHADQLTSQISLKMEELRVNDQKIREISIKRLPNQKQIVSCMFSVGIINEQIYVLQLKKHLKKEISLSELQVKKIRKERKFPQIKSLLGSFSKDLNECISNRKIYVDCQNSEIVVFKVFTVIYMHCKTLYLKNICSLMSKTSYFSEQFKEIYDFPQFEKYILNLIERFKGNQILLGQQKDSQDCIENTLKIIVDEAQFNFLNWILKTFCFVAERTFFIKIGHNKTLIKLISKRKLSELPKEGSQSILRIKFNGLNKTSVFD